jgi:hypothetical protein
MRKRCNRSRVAPLAPRCMRPRLDPKQRRDLELVHLVNLDTIHRGEADEATLWQVVGGALTWVEVALALKLGEAEMDTQLALTTRLVEHYRDTGRIEFLGGDYELAKVGVDVMNELAKEVDRPTAIAAAVLSEQRLARMSEGCHV